jgi:hypothetical protein
MVKHFPRGHKALGAIFPNSEKRKKKDEEFNKVMAVKNQR